MNLYCQSLDCDGHLSIDDQEHLKYAHSFDNSWFIDSRDALNWFRAAWSGCERVPLANGKWRIRLPEGRFVSINQLWDLEKLLPSREEINRTKGQE